MLAVSGLGAIGLAVPPTAAGSRRENELIVSKSGRRGTLSTLEAAVTRARSSNVPVRIRLERGVYREKLTVDVPGLTILGDGPDSVIAFDAAAGLRRPDGERWGTGGSATLTLTAPDITLAHLTVRNDFDFLADQRTGASGGAQAVALSLATGADRTLVRDCRIEGYQDTLYVRSGRALFRACRISGGTDFIFGGAAARFAQCEIVSRAVSGALVQGFVAAPSTPAVQPIGLVFDRCRLTREPGVPDGSVYLGRPWRAGGNMALTGAAAFLDCWMDAHIHPDGWAAMGYRDPAGVQRQLTPQEARLYESRSRGPGAGAAGPTRRQLPPDLTNRLTSQQQFGDWRPR